MKKPYEIVPALALGYIAFSVFLFCLLSPIDHDEHQFMASAFMVAERGLHPYCDFPYFHMPNMVYLYAPFFLLTESPFLAARLFVGLCGLGICLVIFQVTRTLFWRSGQGYALVLAVSSTALIVHSPLFEAATSHVWNHTPSTLCAEAIKLSGITRPERCLPLENLDTSDERWTLTHCSVS
jgi:hypothetical protein